MVDRFDAVVLGMGSGEEVVSDKLLAAGKKVAIVEKELMGGECGYSKSWTYKRLEKEHS